MIPEINLCKTKVSRLIVGGNPFSGNSHASSELNQSMADYFTVENIKETLFRCESEGINTMQVRGDRHMMRMLREFRNEGGKMNWIAQTAPERRSFEESVQEIALSSPIGIYLQGTTADALFKQGEFNEIERKLEIIRKTNLPVGLGTHMPELLRYSQEQGWNPDFYMACVYNISRKNRVSSEITGKANVNESFYPEDIPVMYETVQQIEKPCLVFKILGATRRCQSQASVRAAFEEAFASIKPADAVVVGMFPKELDQVRLNAQYTRDAIAKSQH